MQISYIPYALQTLVASLITIYLLYKWPVLFSGIRQSRLRRYLKITVLTCAFYAAFQPANFGWHKLYSGINAYTLYGGYLYMCLLAILTAVILESIIAASFFKKQSGFIKAIISFTIIALNPLLLEICFSPLLNLSGDTLVANLSFTFWAGCIGGTFYLFFTNYTNNYNLSLQQKELELAKLGQMHMQSQLEALEAKINPHFLYNSLNALAGLSLENGVKASQMAAALSTLFRYNLNKENNNFTTVAGELQMAETYLTIEKIRFEERLQFEINADAGCEQMELPRFLLQPLVENCIKHGFTGHRNALQIGINVHKQSNGLQIEVTDNGTPFKEAMQMGYGLNGIQQKLQLLYPQRHKLSFSNSPKQIIIELHNHE
jgi:two-component system, LytTR family, sensor kinase